MFLGRVPNAQENLSIATTGNEFILAVGAYGEIVSRAISDSIDMNLGKVLFIS